MGVEPDPAKRLRQKQGALIRQCREMRGMTIAELAEAVGATIGAVSHWENGRYTPRQEFQIRLAKALSVPWSTIFGLDAEAMGGVA